MGEDVYVVIFFFRVNTSGKEMEVVMTSFTQERQDGLDFSRMTQNLRGDILEPFLSKFKTMPPLCLN